MVVNVDFCFQDNIAVSEHVYKLPRPVGLPQLPGTPSYTPPAPSLVSKKSQIDERVQGLLTLSIQKGQTDSKTVLS